VVDIDLDHGRKCTRGGGEKVVGKC
jgi:hypothetical protein